MNVQEIGDNEDLKHRVLLGQLGDLARQALRKWDIEEGATASLINLSENATYRIDMPSGDKCILRIHRDGYHSKNAIGSELAWLEALNRDSGVATPPVITGRNGEAIQIDTVEGLAAPRHMVMFGFLEGSEPQADDDLIGPFKDLGEITAELHIHAKRWRRPEDFERLIWDEERIFGPRPNWGDWRQAPAMTDGARQVLQRTEDTIHRRLAAFGKPHERYGLIHADLRLANLLITEEGSTRVIDFDDCGFGWFMYDIAAALSFIEDHPQVDELVAAWVEGYRQRHLLPEQDEAEIPTFIMLRRMVLLAWIGSHSETELAQQQGANFTRVSCDLAERYLSRFG